MITTDEARFLIGNNGANLIALNHVVKRIVDKRKKEEEFKNFTIDVNSYQKQRNEELQNKAKMLAERAKSLHVDVEMEPMTPYERMVVHTTLAGDLKWKQHRLDLEKDRKVVIKYKNTTKTALLRGFSL